MTDETNSEPARLATQDWQHELITRLASASLVEQRRTRRWSVFFRFAFLTYVIVVPLLYMPWGSFWSGGGDEHTAVIDLSGVISADSPANAQRMIEGLTAAFENEDTRGVILRINSPGGSPVQSGQIHDQVLRLRSEYPDIEVYAVVTDICASGGYYVAVAADQIYADKASIVGSIGVISNGFGFVETLDKLGVERRLIAAGENKGFMDPFSPLKAEEVAHFRSVLVDVHEQFIEVVRAGRGERLKDVEELFGGLVWSGERAVELGLIDGLGSAAYVAREVIGVEEMVDFTPRRGALERALEQVGISAATTLMKLNWDLSLNVR